MYVCDAERCSFLGPPTLAKATPLEYLMNVVSEASGLAKMLDSVAGDGQFDASTLFSFRQLLAATKDRLKIARGKDNIPIAESSIVALVSSIEHVLQACDERDEAVHAKALAEAKRALDDATSSLRDCAGGLPGGKIWSEGLAPHVDLKSMLEALNEAALDKSGEALANIDKGVEELETCLKTHKDARSLKGEVVGQADYGDVDLVLQRAAITKAEARLVPLMLEVADSRKLRGEVVPIVRMVRAYKLNEKTCFHAGLAERIASALLGKRGQPCVASSILAREGCVIGFSAEHVCPTLQRVHGVASSADAYLDASCPPRVEFAPLHSRYVAIQVSHHFFLSHSLVQTHRRLSRAKVAHASFRANAHDRGLASPDALVSLLPVMQQSDALRDVRMQCRGSLKRAIARTF